MSSRRLVLYEDRHWRSLRPLTDLLPVPALAFGASDLARRWLTHSQLPLHAIEARSGAMACWHDPPQAAASGGEGEAVVINAAARAQAPERAREQAQALMRKGRARS